MLLAAAIVFGAIPIQATKPTFTTSAVLDFLRPIAFAPAPTGSKVLVCLEDKSVKIFDAKTHQLVRTLKKHVDSANAAAWSPDGVFVATGDEKAHIFIENALTGALVREYQTHTRGIQKLSFNSTRQYLISTGKDDQINVYDLASPLKKEVRKILGKGANFYGATFSPTQPYTFSTGILGPGGRTYDCRTGKVLGFLTTEDSQGVFDLSYNSAGTRIVTAGKNGEGSVFDARTLKKLAALKGHQDFVIYAAFTPNGALMATSSTDRTIKIWNSYTFNKVAELTGQSGVGSPLCFTADGNTLVSVTDSGSIQFTTVTPSQAATTKAVGAIKKSKKRRRHKKSSE